MSENIEMRINVIKEYTKEWLYKTRKKKIEQITDLNGKCVKQ